MKKLHFSCVVSAPYIFKAIVMHNTLESHCKDFHLYILCMDQEVKKILLSLKWKNTTLIDLSTVEDVGLLKAKKNRTHLEYCWTLKPAMLKYVMKKFPSAEYFAHVDADLCFFSNPEAIFNEAPHESLYLTDHNNSDRFMYTYNLTGRYNTGFVGCKNDSTALKAIAWWKNRCIEWCYTENKVAEKLFGDQRYVERWPGLFKDVHIVKTVGANAAHWNIEKYKLSLTNKKVYLNNNELIFYHFSGLGMYNAKEFNLSWSYILPAPAVEFIYLPYLKLLSRGINNVQKNYPKFTKGFIKKGSVPNVHYFKL